MLPDRSRQAASCAPHPAVAFLQSGNQPATPTTMWVVEPGDPAQHAWPIDTYSTLVLSLSMVLPSKSWR